MQDMYKEITKNIFEFNKNTFDNGFKAFEMMQDQAEKTLNTMIEQVTWMPEESRKMINDWVGNCKKGRNEFKKMVDDGFDKAEELMNSGVVPTVSQ